MTQQPNTPAPVEKAAPAVLSKAAKVHAIVNTGPYPGMSEAFNDHMGAECWTDPAYAPDASMWAAAWKAALKAQQAAQPVAWKHDCAALLMNDLELWVESCPHCGKPRTAAPAPAGLVPLTDDQIDEEWFDVHTLPVNNVAKARLFARAIEAAHGIKAGKDVAK